MVSRRGGHSGAGPTVACPDHVDRDRGNRCEERKGYQGLPSSTPASGSQSGGRDGSTALRSLGSALCRHWFPPGLDQVPLRCLAKAVLNLGAFLNLNSNQMPITMR
jgi:hypothetical protein